MRLIGREGAPREPVTALPTLQLTQVTPYIPTVTCWYVKTANVLLQLAVLLCCCCNASTVTHSSRLTLYHIATRSHTLLLICGSYTLK